MSHTLTLEIPDGLYEVLKDVASKLGRTPEEMGAEWLARAVERVTDDPLFAFAGAIKSDVPDWADRHDYYIGQSLAEEMGHGGRAEDDRR